MAELPTVARPSVMTLDDGPDSSWPGPKGQTEWAISALCRQGEPARQFLVRRLPDTTDPQQAALSVLTHLTAGRTRSVHAGHAVAAPVAQGLEPSSSPNAVRPASSR